MKITIETIPHNSQRYSTCGDWFYDEQGGLHIKVSNLSDWRREALVAVHELVEVLLCQHGGVTQKHVDQFDMDFEGKREAALCDMAVSEKDKALIAIEEPGDSPLAPYRNQHCMATAVERMLCAGLGVPWAEYEKEIESLP